VFWLKRNKTTVIPRQKPTTLVSEGPFKLSRNPMYLGMVLFTFGIGMILGSLQALIPAIWLFVFLQKNYVIPEERKMREAMGDQAEAYFATTGRWIWFL
jgi:protein-S-isoprenylcysteine O-methyltransferase Ste14